MNKKTSVKDLSYIKPFGSEAHLSGFRDCDENFQMTDSHSFPPYIIGNSYIFDKIISFYLLIGKCYNPVFDTLKKNKQP